MMKYKGYYIDHIYFNSKKDIDNFIKEQAVERFKKLNQYFADNPTMEACNECSKQASILHDVHGFTYEAIEEMEIEALKTA